ncbi:histidine--tRNA ligase [Imperialibacter roseus]|uniref:Histidine--tRNA ligase n=1 Tax=Imperialibacter roseus TaxID=1324217 RepID=A0ABZ0IKM6_9BACT|nr:histidine--tRNA ligase [Imperialibacter roseus]WOK05018.1 histidine--tRNA ligase [Imperialibacter roseus]
MAAQKPGLARGTRDFGPVQMSRRNYLFGIIRTVFEKFGFQPLETPAIENLATLTGKYGEEGDQLLFKILNSGDFMKNASDANLSERNSKSITPEISEKGLRYDLTVPFARYVVMNQHLHNFPFKRYQIQPVWRADRPQKGRYREFFQCDADVVGTNSLLCEAEIVLMIREVFEKLGLADYSIKLNNRKILSGIAELMGAPGKEGPLCVAIDKLDKIGEEKVFEELKERGFGDDVAKKLQPFLQLTGSNAAIIADLEKLLARSDVGMVGVAELKEVMAMVEGFGVKVDQLAIDPTLARGLSYYTGCIFEVKPTSVQMGSICGGGRYDDLTGMFGLPNVSGVGISFGIDRIYDVLDELNLFPAESLRTSKVLIANFDPASAMKALAVLGKLREGGIAAELYPESAKLKKQFTYAESKGIPFLLMAGESEFASGEFGLKNLQSGEQKTFTIEQIISELR